MRSAVAAARAADPGKPVTVVDTLAASLACTDPRCADGALYISDDLSSMSFAEGYDLCTERALRSTEMDAGTEEGTVVLLGYGLMDKGWTYGLDEMRGLLSLMGARVVCAPGCMPTGRELRACGKAEASILVDPARSVLTSHYLEEKGVAPVVPSMGAPVGWRATESFLTEVAEAVGADPDPALRRVAEERSAVARRMKAAARDLYFFPGRCFDASGPSSLVYPLATWVAEDFRMAPRRLSLLDGFYGREVGRLSERFDVGPRPDETLGAVFSDGIGAEEGSRRGDDASHVDIRPPTARPFDLLGRTMVGPAGCRYVVDSLLNSGSRFRCGQPLNADDRRFPGIWICWQ